LEAVTEEYLRWKQQVVMTYDWSGVVGHTSIILAQFTSRENKSFINNHLTTNLLIANNNIIIPESVRISTIALPAKVNTRRLGLNAAPLPLRRIRVAHTGLRRQPRDSSPVEPGLDAAVRADVVLEAAPGVGGDGDGGGDALGREVWESGVVGFTVVHQDLGLSADAQVLVGALGGVGVSDECDVGVGECLCGFAVVELDDGLRTGGKYLQVGPDIKIARGHLVCADEDVTAVTSRAINTDGVLAGVRSRGVESDLSTLVAVWRIRCPGSLIPAILKAFRDLGNGEGRKSQREKSGLTKHV
jgi:hypothetical protein